MPAGRFRVNHNQSKAAVKPPAGIRGPVKPKRTVTYRPSPDQEDRQRQHAAEQRRFEKGQQYKRRTQSDLRNFGFQGASYRQAEWRQKQALLRGVIQAGIRQKYGMNQTLSKNTVDHRGMLEKKLMGYAGGSGLYKKIDKKILQSVGQAGDIGLQTFPGLYQAGKAGVQDFAPTLVGKPPSTKHTLPLVKGMVQSTEESIKHPTRNVPLTALNVLAAATAGAGAIGRVGAAGAAANEAAQAGARAGVLKAALTRPTSEGGSLLFKPPPGVAKVTAAYKGPEGVSSVVAKPGHYFREMKSGKWKEVKMTEDMLPGLYEIKASKTGAWEVNGSVHTVHDTGVEMPVGKPTTAKVPVKGAKKAKSTGPGGRVSIDKETGLPKVTRVNQRGLIPGTIKAPTGYKFIQLEPGKFKLVKDNRMIPGKTELTAGENETILPGKNNTHIIKDTSARDFLLPRADNPLLRPLTDLKAHMLQKSIDNPEAATMFGQRIPGAHEAMTIYKARVLGNDLVRTGKWKAEMNGTSYSGTQFIQEARQHGLIGPDSLAEKMWNNRKVDETQMGKAAHFVTHYGSRVNRPFRFFGVYLRPAYFFTNYPGNVAMGAMNQGFRIVPSFKRAGIGGRGTTRRLGADTTKEIDRDMGSGRAVSLTLGTATSGDKLIGKPMFGSQKLGAAEKTITHGISLLTDRQFRHASWDFRARQLGYKTAEQQRALMLDPKHLEDREVVKRLANKDAVDFDSLHPRERELVDLIYFYPWMSRATVWTGRAAVNRPIKSAVLAAGAEQAQAQERKDLGPFPSWMKGYAGAGPGKVINTQPLSTAATPGQVLQFAAGGRAGRRAIAEEFGTPAIQFMSTNPGDWYRNIVQSTGPLGLFLGKPSKTFPSNPFEQRMGRYFLGSPYVRRKFSQKQVASQAKKEMSPVDKANFNDQQERAQIIGAAHKLGLLDGNKLPGPIRDAYNRKHERYLNRAKLAEKMGVNKLSGKDMFLADTDLLYKVGVWPKSEHDAAQQWAKTQYKNDKTYKFGKALGQLNKYFNYGSIIAEARKGIIDRGGKLD